MIEAYTKMIKNFAVFSGRATVGEYWWPMLVHIIVAILRGILVGFVPSLVVLTMFTTLHYGSQPCRLQFEDFMMWA